MFGLGRKLTGISKTQSGWMACIKLKFTTSISESVQRGRVDRLLHRASTFGDVDIARHLLDAGVGVSPADGEGLTPLYVAARNGHEAVARLLVDRGAEVSGADCWGTMPLHYAAGSGHGMVARLLVDQGADVSGADRWGTTPLHHAVKNGSRHWHGCSWIEAPTSRGPTTGGQRRCTTRPRTDSRY